MKKIILKSSKDIEREAKEVQERKICPECGYDSFDNFLYSRDETRFIGDMRYYIYSCGRCGCRWYVKKRV